jgi:hypothetical protein
MSSSSSSLAGLPPPWSSASNFLLSSS